MEEGFGLAVVNIEFLKLKFSLGVFFMLLGLWAVLILFIYFFWRYRQVVREEIRLKQINEKCCLTQKLEMKNKLLELTWGEFLTLFLTYREKFIIDCNVKNIKSLFESFNKQEILNIEWVIYANQVLSKNVEKKMKKMLNSLW